MRVSYESEQINYLAVGGEVPHYGLLSREAVDQFKKIQTFLAEEWTKACNLQDENRKAWLWRINGCLEKLATVLFQVSRIKKHEDELRRFVKGCRKKLPSGGAAAFLGREACSDFEALLLQGRAALDRLTLFVATQYKQQCDDFPKLKNILEKFAPKHEKASKLLGVLKYEEWFHRIFIDFESAKSLRSFVAHQGGVSETVENCFQITRLTDTTVLILDCEVRGIPVLETSGEAAQHFPFLILNCLSVICLGEMLDFNYYQPPWQMRSTVFSRFVSDKEDDPMFLVIARMTPSGFDAKKRHVKPTLFARAVPIG